MAGAGSKCQNERTNLLKLVKVMKVFLGGSNLVGKFLKSEKSVISNLEMLSYNELSFLITFRVI